MKEVAPKVIETVTIYKDIVPFMIIQLIGVALVFTFPMIATWLPTKAYG
jgi:TRAP-type mannitol/chloroaromatic compound transport system permease large subunit